MKKILIICAFLLAQLPAAAQQTYGIEQGDTQLSGFVGGSFPTNKYDVEEDFGDDLDWADDGVSLGGQVMYFANPYLGIGAELSGSFFDYAETPSYFRADNGTLWRGKLETRMQTVHLMAAARVNINPANRFRVYIPGGIGAAFSRGEMRFGRLMEEKETSTGFAYYIGLGAEFAIKPQLIVGGEVRYTGFDFKAFGERYDLQYASVLAKVAYKF